jgi:hypothetical protein
MMTFTFRSTTGGEQTYEGFRAYRVPETIQPGEELVIVEWDGEYENWIVESGMGIQELARYYRMTYYVDLEIDRLPIATTFPIDNPHMRRNA